VQLWQHVFRETFVQYQKLSARLVQSEDSAGALRLWRDYLLSLQTFLSAAVPQDYDGLTQQQYLCEVSRWATKSSPLACFAIAGRSILTRKLKNFRRNECNEFLKQSKTRKKWVAAGAKELVGQRGFSNRSYHDFLVAVASPSAVVANELAFAANY